MNVSKSNATIIGTKGCANIDPAKLPQDHLFIDDPRAPSLNIDYTNETYRCLPSTERFSAHTGICEILGSKSLRDGSKHGLSVGDIIRFGSVGVLVSEINTESVAETMSNFEVNELITKIVSKENEEEEGIPSGDSGTDDEAVELVEEEHCSKVVKSPKCDGVSTCYVCYDESEEDNPLIAPCKCSGDTKYIHVDCLKRWNTGDDKNEICTVIDENNARSCSICKTAYPNSTKTKDGKIVSLLPDSLDSPSITFIVVTKHSTPNMSTNTKFQLSVKSLMNGNGDPRPLLVGRSSKCDMILKYRTVSTIHAELHYSNGGFFVRDICSSNGTLRYIYKPLALPLGKPTHLKFGRTIVSLKVKKKLCFASLFSGFALHTSNSDAPPTTTMRMDQS